MARGWSPQGGHTATATPRAGSGNHCTFWASGLGVVFAYTAGMTNNNKPLLDSYRPVHLNGVTLYLPTSPPPPPAPSSWNAPPAWSSLGVEPGEVKHHPSELPTPPPVHKHRDAIHGPAPSMVRRARSQATDVATVHIQGDRVAWSMSTDWSPMTEALGDRFVLARDAGLAGVRKDGKAHRVIRDLLNQGAKGVVVYGDISARCAYVTRPSKGGSIRCAWSDTIEWNPVTTGRSLAYLRAYARNEAGIATGVEGLKKVLAGFVPNQDN